MWLGCPPATTVLGFFIQNLQANTIAGQPHNPMVNSGAIMSAALLLYMVKPEMSVSEKFEYVHDFFTRMAGRHNVGFQNSVFLSERDTADRNHAIAYYLRENHCFPEYVKDNFLDRLY